MRWYRSLKSTTANYSAKIQLWSCARWTLLPHTEDTQPMKCISVKRKLEIRNVWNGGSQSASQTLQLHAVNLLLNSSTVLLFLFQSKLFPLSKHFQPFIFPKHFHCFYFHLFFYFRANITIQISGLYSVHHFSVHPPAQCSARSLWQAEFERIV